MSDARDLPKDIPTGGLGPVKNNRYAPSPPPAPKDVMIRPGVVKKPDGHFETVDYRAP